MRCLQIMAYVGPDVTLPVTSFLAGLLACLLVFIRPIVQRCRRWYRRLRGFPLDPPDAKAEALPDAGAG